MANPILEVKGTSYALGGWTTPAALPNMTLGQEITSAFTYTTVGTKEYCFVGGVNRGGLQIGCALDNQVSLTGGNGAWLSLDGSSNWIKVQCSKPANATEFIVYGNSYTGLAYATGATTIKWIYGSTFKNGPSGDDFYRDMLVGNIFYFGDYAYKIKSIENWKELTLEAWPGNVVPNFTYNGAASSMQIGKTYRIESSDGNSRFTSAGSNTNAVGSIFTCIETVGGTGTVSEVQSFTYTYNSGNGLCKISGNKILFKSGDPFTVAWPGTDLQMYLNIGGNRIKLTTIPGETASWIVERIMPPAGDCAYVYAGNSLGDNDNVEFYWQQTIGNESSVIRVHGTHVDTEECLNIQHLAGDFPANILGRHYSILTVAQKDPNPNNSQGYYHPLFIGSGTFSESARFYRDYSYNHTLGIYNWENDQDRHQGYVSLGGVQGRESMRVYAPMVSNAQPHRFEIVPSYGDGGHVELRAENSVNSVSNIDIKLTPKGNGKVQFGTFVPTTGKNGYVTIRLEDGRYARLSAKISTKP